MYLVAEEAECLDIREILPIGRVDLVAIERIPLDDREGECEDKE